MKRSTGKRGIAMLWQTAPESILSVTERLYRQTAQNLRREQLSAFREV